MRLYTSAHLARPLRPPSLSRHRRHHPARPFDPTQKKLPGVFPALPARTPTPNHTCSIHRGVNFQFAAHGHMSHSCGCRTKSGVLTRLACAVWAGVGVAPRSCPAHSSVMVTSTSPSPVCSTSQYMLLQPGPLRRISIGVYRCLHPLCGQCRRSPSMGVYSTRAGAPHPHTPGQRG